MYYPRAKVKKVLNPNASPIKNIQVELHARTIAVQMKVVVLRTVVVPVMRQVILVLKVP